MSSSIRDFSLTRRERIDGLATFALVAFALAVAIIAVLERVGASDAFVEALGPLAAFVALGVIGLANRAGRLADFLSARRIAPALYGGLGFAATAAGLALALDNGQSLVTVPFALGVAFAGLLLAPAIRAGNVSAASDVLATRYPGWPTRGFFALAAFAVGVLTATAGFSLANRALAAAFDGNQRLATAFDVVALAFTLLPGGARSAIWSDAACGGGALVIAFSGAALAVVDLPAPFVPVATELARFSADAGALIRAPAGAISLAAALTFFLPLTSPAMTAASVGEAWRMGFVGTVLGALGLAAAAMALPLTAAAPGGAVHTATSLAAAATWLPTLALSRAGVLVASRAAGLDLTRAYSRLTVLSSRRVAFSRLTMLATIAIAPAALSRAALTPDRALTLALAISLALLAPSLLLGLTLRTRGSSLTAAAALAAAMLTAAMRIQFQGSSLSGPGALEAALSAGAMGLACGAVVALAFPERRGAGRLPAADPFAETPFDTEA
ncbi:MAG: hypothetical protein ACLPN5_16030 [Roseiarcus sp.]